jgi:hypothetical protein
MPSSRKEHASVVDLKALLSEIVVDAHDEDEQLMALRDAIEAGADLPADAYVIGEPVAVLEVDYDGNERRGLTALCRRSDDGTEHVISLADVLFKRGSEASRHAAAYRLWLGLDPLLPTPPGELHYKLHKASTDDIDMDSSVDLVVLALRSNAVRCRVAGSDRVITLRATGVGLVVPGEVLTILPNKQWSFSGHPYISGTVESTRIDAEAIGLVPLQLHERNSGSAFELEQVFPGDPLEDPVARADDLLAMGDVAGARDIVKELLESDLRFLDGHAWLGDRENQGMYRHGADRHYKVGVRIGELSLDGDFEGTLPWGLAGNRPFLRCLRGLGECHWDRGRPDEAVQVFERLLRLDPEDGQDIRAMLAALRTGETWETYRSEEWS